MIATLGTVPLPPVSTEVMAFAAERGVSAYVPAILEMTRRLFPTAPIGVVLEADPEIAEQRQLVFEVHVPDLDVERLLGLHNQWIQGLFQLCPATHVHVFSLGMV